MRRRRCRHRPQRAQIAGGGSGELPVAKERGDLTDPLVGGHPGRWIGRCGRIDAPDRVERVLVVAVVPVCIPAVIVVGKHQQVAGVAAALQPQQTTGQVLPALRAVQRVDGARRRVGVAQATWIRRLTRLLHQRVNQGVVAVDPLGRVGAQRAGRRAGAVGGVVIESGLKSRHLADAFLDWANGWIDSAVEDHRPHMSTEPFQVSGAQLGAVAVSEVVDLIVT
ncbi:Uncharacterised protein [Mycobacterium tuberculosis]|uniref:Uncharacterized protein n=1 Tax=Mycobacterium tuberculosis TaxID=1773 RepID=A0A655AE11_MYCTX|nr:Uncharacterised protein [Mycobacterium tuberculosis]CKS77898.1 Uncharacterised protein [Mycobacterium tuberculosis]CKT50332.1 Uncharacterised protein [Mycobacterium tuberculosis]CKT50334.1 Uncharacterised protein [Mycobacterium tuberculosis]CKV04298.1 Uncharacterised protein [Mycobacterium tuberculosis]